MRVGNKDYVVDFAVKLATLLKTSRDFLRSAAADLDSLKREQLQCQSKLLVRGIYPLVHTFSNAHIFRHFKKI